MVANAFASSGVSTSGASGTSGESSSYKPEEDVEMSDGTERFDLAFETDVSDGGCGMPSTS